LAADTVSRATGTSMMARIAESTPPISGRGSTLSPDVDGRQGPQQMVGSELLGALAVAVGDRIDDGHVLAGPDHQTLFVTQGSSGRVASVRWPVPGMRLLSNAVRKRESK
jgi:hypothetical protein